MGAWVSAVESPTDCRQSDVEPRERGTAAEERGSIHVPVLVFGKRRSAASNLTSPLPRSVGISPSRQPVSMSRRMAGHGRRCLRAFRLDLGQHPAEPGQLSSARKRFPLLLLLLLYEVARVPAIGAQAPSLREIKHVLHHLDDGCQSVGGKAISDQPPETHSWRVGGAFPGRSFQSSGWETKQKYTRPVQRPAISEHCSRMSGSPSGPVGGDEQLVLRRAHDQLAHVDDDLTCVSSD